jgi:hypothetical protein
MIDGELDWLATERPSRALTHTSTSRARTALLEHIEASAKPLPPAVTPCGDDARAGAAACWP